MANYSTNILYYDNLPYRYTPNGENLLTGTHRMESRKWEVGTFPDSTPLAVNGKLNSPILVLSN